MPNGHGVVTLAGHGHIANLMAPDLLADAIRNFASRVLCPRRPALPAARHVID